jgi:hypothetical protein
MSKNTAKRHVFNTRKQKVIKNARPLKADKPFIPMESLTALLCEIPVHDTTIAVSRRHAPELQVKIKSASMTVLASNFLSLDESHTSDTTSFFTEDIGCSMSDTHEDPATTELSSKKAIPDVFSRPILPPAYLPLYINKRSPKDMKPITSPKLPGYARPSTSLCYSRAANWATQGTLLGFTPAGTALRRLNSGRGDRALRYISSRYSRCPNSLVDVPSLNMAAENGDVVSGQQLDGAVKVGIVTASTQAVGTPIDVAEFLTYAETPVPESETPLASEASMLDIRADSEVTLCFEPESLLSIDPNFSESDYEAEDGIAVVRSKALSKTLHCPDNDIPREDLSRPKPHVKRAALHKV